VTDWCADQIVDKNTSGFTTPQLNSAIDTLSEAEMREHNNYVSKKLEHLVQQREQKEKDEERKRREKKKSSQSTQAQAQQKQFDLDFFGRSLANKDKKDREDECTGPGCLCHDGFSYCG
jgi:hypothetical protein